MGKAINNWHLLGRPWLIKAPSEKIYFTQIRANYLTDIATNDRIICIQPKLTRRGYKITHLGQVVTRNDTQQFITLHLKPMTLNLYLPNNATRENFVENNNPKSCLTRIWGRNDFDDLRKINTNDIDDEQIVADVQNSWKVAISEVVISNFNHYKRSIDELDGPLKAKGQTIIDEYNTIARNFDILNQELQFIPHSITHGTPKLNMYMPHIHHPQIEYFQLQMKNWNAQARAFLHDIRAKNQN